MKITVNLDTQAVITQPSPLRFKAGCFNSVEIAFTRSSQSVPLPDGAVIEFTLKPRNQWTGGLLAYLNLFTPSAGNLYAGLLNCASEAILNALGLSDQTSDNDVAQLDASAEVTWSFSGQKFRSITFPVTVETPLTDEIPVATPDPELYPVPSEVARKGDIPKIAVPSDAIAGIRADVTMSPLAVTQWFDAKLPGAPSLALLGNGSWGLPDLSNYNGSLAGDGTSVTGVSGIQLHSLFGNQFFDNGTGCWVSNVTLKAPGMNGIYGASFFDNHGTWSFNNGIEAPHFSGDGSQLQNVFAQNAYCDQYGNSIAQNYVQQSGYYGGLSVGNADWTNISQYASYANSASYDTFGCQLYGAGNIQSNFFGGSPHAGDVATFNGTYWSPGSSTPLPTTVANTAGRFASSGLRTGWLVKQLDNRTVYQVLNPNDYATELGWVPVGPFILVPSNSTPLVIDNNAPILAATIHCTAGTWSDAPTSYAYQWKRNGSAISGATTLTYTVVAADDGANLQCVVSATNAAGTGTDSAAIPVVVLNPPVNTVVPAITPASTPNVGDTLSLTSGTWTGYGYTTSYQWKRAGTAIAGATAATYTLVVADAGQTITCTITRTNIRGTATGTTATTAAVTNLIAVNTAIPTLSITTPFTGAVLTCSPGTWNYHPISYSYQWRRNGVVISGATGSTYTVVTADVGKTISCTVTATNPAGTSGTVATAESSSVIVALPSPIQGALADSSLVAHWSLDEASGTRYDLTGNGINLTPNANGGAITNAVGKFGMAANIPPRSYLSATDSRFANVKTICGWFKLSAANNSYQRLLGSWIQVYSGSSGIAWDKNNFATGIVPTPGQWYFICAVYTGTTFKLWVNNQSFVAQTVATGTPFLGSTFQIGDPSFESVAMLFDEVACWNRALTDAEVTTLATA